MSVLATCPRCNAVFSVGESFATSEKVECPRCGERVTPLVNESAEAGSMPKLPVDVPSSQSRRSDNRRLAWALFAAMVLLAGIVTIWLVNTRDKRRLTQLAESPGLGYLPSDSNLILGVNFLEAARSDLGPEALDRIGFRAQGRLDPERWVGLTREQIGVMLFGLRVDTNLVPRLRLVVRTRSRINTDAVRSRLQARSPREAMDRPHFLATPSALGVEMALWFPDAQTMVLAYPPAELRNVPLQPQPETRRFSAPIHDLLLTRSERESFLWVVAHDDDWSQTSLPVSLNLVPWGASLRPILSQIRTVGMACREDKGQTATRARPARITTPPPEAPPTVAVDLVFLTAPEVELPNLIDRLESWSDRHHLLLRDQNREGLRFSATLTGTPADWEAAVDSFVRPK
jgi:DNA-directed RNA polymerase subunit RPC12/RpoP